jgi:hypothetical protein
MNRTSVFGNRFASGDRGYTDFSLWWYWAQTDWSGGIKDDKKWEDDAKYYYSTNIDAYSEVGKIKLAKAETLEKDFDEEVQCGVNATVNAVNNNYIGTGDDASGNPKVYKESSGVWSDISGTTIITNKSEVNQLLEHKSMLWVLTEGGGTTTTVLTYDGSSFSDKTAQIVTDTSLTQLLTSSCGFNFGETLYLACQDSPNKLISICHTDDGGTSFTEDVLLNTGGTVLDMIGYEGDLYYLLNEGSKIILKKYDITNSVDSIISEYNNSKPLTSSVGGKLLFNRFGKLIITIPEKEIWEYESGIMTRVYRRTDDKNDIGREAFGYLKNGGVFKDNKIFWGNLIYDGETFYNYKKDYEDATTVTDYFPVFIDDDDVAYWLKSITGNTKLYKESSTVYRSGEDKNFIVFNEMEEVSTIDKVANVVRIIYDPFGIGEEIVVYYSINGGSSYTELGTASRTIDGSSSTQKTFLFGDDVSFRKIIFKVYLNGDGTSTPSLNDISLEYLPIPDYKYEWDLTLNSNNNLKLLDNNTEFPLSGTEIRDKVRASFLKKEVISFEDVDYQETKINDGSGVAVDDTTITVDSTDGFPNSGRLKINKEEIFYTGKNATQFTGCTRGYRGTPASTHSDDDVVSTKYRVIVTDYGENNPVIDDENAIDYLIKIKLTEV